MKRDFNLTTFEKSDIFADVLELEGSTWLTETLKYYLPIVRGSNSEKARSELIIAPILVDFRRQLNEQVSLCSGIDFSVDDTKGLNGICDFLITKSTEILIVTSPVIIIVEAKKESGQPLVAAPTRMKLPLQTPGIECIPQPISQ